MKLLKEINHMLIYECDNLSEMSEKVGNKIIAQVKYKPYSNIALQSGFSIIPVCNYLIKNRRKMNTSYHNVNFFAINEYGVIDFGAQMTHKSFMDRYFYKPIHTNKKNIHYPNQDCQNYDFSRYDRLIYSAGGIDLAIISVGITGELGFNSTNTNFDSLTHAVKLSLKMIKSEADSYRTEERLIPKIGITMGIYTIFNCRNMVLVASGAEKAEAISKLIKGEMTTKWPVTALLRHRNIEVYVDSKLVAALSKYIKH